MTDRPDRTGGGPGYRELAAGQRAQLWIADAVTGRSELLLESGELLFEAPNWTLDGARLIVNGAGQLWSVPLDAPALTPIPLDGVPPLNNDHVLAPDGARIFVSATDWHIYEASLAGGPTRRITTADGLMHFLHGVSPDGERLAFIGLEPAAGGTAMRADVFTMSAGGGDYRRITDTDHPADGSEYSPDGRWLYFNTEQFTGHAQLARVPVEGGAPERLRRSDTVDWFPHLSPDGRRAAFVAFPPGTEGHPADLWVDIMTARTDDWPGATPVARIFGGQGSLNVNSWAPDSTRFAYVAYPGTRSAA
ncbi:biopolymer transporter Tol [Dactylosporangium sp. NPDC049140]|uniref:biopolymer transporter Tol n=1 Tax=Dactylosporangium sp. NPDC049140 TaxID=3155647 RepID=UPI0033C4AD3C